MPIRKSDSPEFKEGKKQSGKEYYREQRKPIKTKAAKMKLEIHAEYFNVNNIVPLIVIKFYHSSCQNIEPILFGGQLN